MRTTSIIKLHEKCIGIAELIAQANKKRIRFEMLFALRKEVTPRNELTFFPIGQPDWRQVRHDLEITVSAQKRLIDYYNKTLLRIHNIFELSTPKEHYHA